MCACRSGKWSTTEWFQARHIVDMEVDSCGRRWWLVAWDGVDKDGNPWADSWQLTKDVREPLRSDFLDKKKQRVARLIQVDVQPTDLLVQRAMSDNLMKQVTASFGHVFETEIPALSLHDVAIHYLQSVAARFGLEVHKQYNPTDKSTTYAVTLADQEQIGSFCSFEKVAPTGTAVASLRFKLGRASNEDATIVGALQLRAEADVKRTPGLVKFMAEYHEAWINGATGNIVGPHLSADSDSPLKDEKTMRDVITYARRRMPDTHRLMAKGWAALPPHVFELPAAQRFTRI